MLEVIEQERKRRLAFTHDEMDQLLIQDGGYISPIETLWEDVLLAVVLKKPVLLKGPTGSGKTRLAQSISHYFQQPMHSVNCSVDLDAEALLGFKTIVHKNEQAVIEFVEGPVIQAMKKGHLLYIDEINMAKPEILPILHSVLDHRRMLTNPFTNEVIQAHPSFSIISAINEGYVGTTPMNEALKNRFVSYSIPYLSGDELKKLFHTSFPEASTMFIHQLLSIHEDLQSQVRDGLVSEEAASIRSFMNTLELAQYIPVKRAIRYALWEKLDDRMEQELVRELVETWVD